MLNWVHIHFCDVWKWVKKMYQEQRKFSHSAIWKAWLYYSEQFWDLSSQTANTYQILQRLHTTSCLEFHFKATETVSSPGRTLCFFKTEKKSASIIQAAQTLQKKAMLLTGFVQVWCGNTKVTTAVWSSKSGCPNPSAKHDIQCVQSNYIARRDLQRWESRSWRWLCMMQIRLSSL